MSLRIWEKFTSRSGTEGENATAELGYVVQGTTDDREVRELVAATAPLVHDLLNRQDFAIEPIGIGLWDVAVQYGLPDAGKQKKKPGDKGSLTFDTTGGTQHIQFSRKTTPYFDQQQGPDGQQAPPAAPDYKGLIGVNDDKVEGCDVIVPQLRFSETHYFRGIAFAYLNLLYRLTGTVNEDRFRGFAPGEVLFAGAQGNRRDGGPMEVTYNFDCSPNVERLKIGDIVVARKAGWDYLWVKWEDAYDETAKMVVKRPLAVYVEEVYPRTRFSQLAFGPEPDEED
ncbi:MAG: hypothetical protein RIC55_24370 [Pirellulaceae bacterium]